MDILYFTLSRNKVTRRRVDPFALWFHDGTFYLIGRCHLKKCVLVFAVDRIRSFEETGDTFPHPADLDPERFMARSFGVFQREPVEEKNMVPMRGRALMLVQVCKSSAEPANVTNRRVPGRPTEEK